MITAAGLLLQETVAGVLADLQRSPAAWHGDWWRWGTALVTQDGHLPGGLFNIAGLLLVGAAAEQALTRRGWLVAYVGAGLVGQVVGHWWQPTGAGNSVAVCGLAAVLAVQLVRRPSSPTALGVWAPVMWCAALAAAPWPPMLYLGLVVCLLATGPFARPPWTSYVAGACVLASAALLILDRDIHGGTIAIALVTAAVRPGTAQPASPAGSSAGSPGR